MIAGEKFEHWQVLGADATGKRIACRCDCGVVRIIGASALRSGACTSCGCQKPTAAQREAFRQTRSANAAFRFRFLRENPMTEIGEITLITFTDGKIAEIAIDPTTQPVSAAKLVRAMTMRAVTCAKIIRIQTAKRNPATAV
jgi:hypothetical protein